MLEFGILGKVDEIPDESMRFYALIGLCVSTAAAIEHHMYDCYLSTCGKSERDATKLFYKDVRFAHRRDLTNENVRATLANSTLLPVWDEIICQIQAVCGPDGARNLVSHNPLTRFHFIRKNEDGSPRLQQGSALYSDLAVNQNHNITAAGLRPPSNQTFQTLKSYAYDLCSAELRIADFHTRHLAIRS